MEDLNKRLQFTEVKNMETAYDISTACCLLQNLCILFGDSGEDFTDDVEYQELNAYNHQPLNDVDGITKRDRIAINLPRN